MLINLYTGVKSLMSNEPYRVLVDVFDSSMLSYLEQYTKIILDSGRMLKIKEGHYVYEDLLFSVIFTNKIKIKLNCELVVIYNDTYVKEINIYDYIFSINCFPPMIFFDHIKNKVKSLQLEPFELLRLNRSRTGMLGTNTLSNMIYFGLSTDSLKRDIQQFKTEKIVLPEPKPFDKSELETPLFRYSLN